MTIEPHQIYNSFSSRRTIPRIVPNTLKPGLYEQLITHALQELLAGASQTHQTWNREIESSAVAQALAQHLHELLERTLRGIPEDSRIARATEIANALLRSVRELGPDIAPGEDENVASPPRLLLAVRVRGTHGLSDDTVEPPRPSIPLRTSALLTNGPRDIRLGAEIPFELESADRVDLLCSFLKWSGFRLLQDDLKRFLERRPGALRVLTTTYLGATDRRAVDALVALGATVSISYDSDRTRLHAKAWLFHRDTGYSTGFVGSSNLSRDALLDGLEWNVRLSVADNGPILKKFAATFDQYWAESEFEVYDPTRDRDQFDRAVATQTRDDSSPFFFNFDIEPKSHQKQILDALELERAHGHMRNLVVAATGTGKTIAAALDYRRFRDQNDGRARLLFVAHRSEILKQSRDAFRVILRDGSFGELLVDGNAPTDGSHVFASIQSLHRDRIGLIAPDFYDFVIVDEFHHAAAPTYRSLLERLRPRILLGLTATPERTDAQDVLAYFDGRIAFELRLWTALDQNLLAPFQYFGIADGTDLSTVEWRRGAYDVRQLENVFTGDDVRVKRVLQALRDKIRNVGSMRALGFCVSIPHAEFMAQRFSEAGIPSLALSTNSHAETRRTALEQLRSGAIKALFAVDLLNEGIDVPDIDTVLFLRPTESATLFLQQLGRGLRRSPNKDCLTVLDFVGQARREFRFDLRYRALVGGTRRDIEHHVESGFPTLPPGCSIQLDRVAKETVLANIRAALRGGMRSVVRELRGYEPDITLGRFLEDTGLTPEDIYTGSASSWTVLKRLAGHLSVPAQPGEDELRGTLGRMLHVSDSVRVETYRRWLASPDPPALAPENSVERRLQYMLLADFDLADRPLNELGEALRELWSQDKIRIELVELLGVLEDRSRTPCYPLEESGSSPLQIHAEYSLAEVFAGMGVVRENRLYRAFRQGVYWNEPTRTDMFFVTLEKTENEYSPSTMYDDYPISPTLFHWETQSTTSLRSPTGQRYINHDRDDSRVLLFVRLRKSVDGHRTAPYIFLGPVHYVEHRGDRPIQITWRLERPMPAVFWGRTKTAAG